MSVVPDPAPERSGAEGGAEQILELLEERVEVARRTVAGQTVRVATQTHVREQVVEEALARETVEVERVAIGQVVPSAPPIREEGDFIIVPVMEEVLVVERRLVLKEEIRLRRVRTTEVHRETVQLREQAATVSRIEPGGMPGRPEQAFLDQTQTSSTQKKDTL